MDGPNRFTPLMARKKPRMSLCMASLPVEHSLKCTRRTSARPSRSSQLKSDKTFENMEHTHVQEAQQRRRVWPERQIRKRASRRQQRRRWSAERLRQFEEAPTANTTAEGESTVTVNRESLSRSR